MNNQKPAIPNNQFNKGRNAGSNNREGRSRNSESGFEEKVIQVDRVSRTVKGGKRMRFRALVAIGNRNGRVGVGIGKAQEVILAVQKAVSDAKKNMIDVPIKNDTIPHDVNIEYGSSKIILRPARAGTSIIAGSSVRVILELSGIKNILSKILGSNNKINNAKATIYGLQSLVKPKEEVKPENIKEKTNETPKDNKTKSKK